MIYECSGDVRIPSYSFNTTPIGNGFQCIPVGSQSSPRGPLCSGTLGPGTCIIPSGATVTLTGSGVNLIGNGPYVFTNTMYEYNLKRWESEDISGSYVNNNFIPAKCVGFTALDLHCVSIPFNDGQLSGYSDFTGKWIFEYNPAFCRMDGLTANTQYHLYFKVNSVEWPPNGQGTSDGNIIYHSSIGVQCTSSGTFIITEGIMFDYLTSINNCPYNKSSLGCLGCSGGTYFGITYSGMRKYGTLNVM